MLEVLIRVSVSAKAWSTVVTAAVLVCCYFERLKHRVRYSLIAATNFRLQHGSTAHSTAALTCCCFCLVFLVNDVELLVRSYHSIGVL